MTLSTSPAPGHAHAHGHHHHDAAPRLAPVRIGASVLRLSLAGRLLVAGVMIAALWGAVALVLGGAS